jgi:Flp pilus assembly protein TadD
MRAGVVAALVGVVALTFVAHLGNSYLARSADALARGDDAGAASSARTARRWLPWSYEPWQRLGEAQLAAGRLAEARRSFDRALALDRTNWALWYERGLASTGSARRGSLREALRLNPRSPEVAELEASAPHD